MKQERGVVLLTVIEGCAVELVQSSQALWKSGRAPLSEACCGDRPRTQWGNTGPSNPAVKFNGAQMKRKASKTNRQSLENSHWIKSSQDAGPKVGSPAAQMAFV